MSEVVRSIDTESGLQIGQKQRYIEIAPNVFAEVVAVGGSQLAVEDNSLSVIAHAHRLAHESRFYHVSDTAEHGSELSNDGQLNIALTTGGWWAHTLFICEAGGDAELIMSLGPDVSGGTPFVPINHNLSASAPAAYSSALVGVTVNDAGTRKRYRFVPGGSGPLATGDESRADNELRVPPETTVLYQLFNRSGTAQIMALHIAFYEQEFN